MPVLTFNDAFWQQDEDRITFLFFCTPGGKKRECSTIFKLKPGKSARNIGIVHSEHGQALSGADCL
jgi:hypothetical protein